MRLSERTGVAGLLQVIQRGLSLPTVGEIGTEDPGLKGFFW